MRLTQVVFTTINDREGEKMTEVVEFGPFDSSKAHPIEAFFKWLEDREAETKPEIIT